MTAATSRVDSSNLSTPDPDGSRVRARGGPALVVTVLAICGIVVSLQQTLLLPLLPALPGMLDTTADSASWLVTATLLAGAIATPTVSRLADMYGKRRMMVLALAAPPRDPSSAPSARLIGARPAGRRTGDGVALDTTDLDPAADRLEGEAEMLLDPDLGGILHMLRGAAEHLAQRTGSHRTGRADLGPGRSSMIPVSCRPAASLEEISYHTALRVSP